MVSEKEIIQAVKRIRDTAMEQTLAARIPESGEFGAIAQDADWLFDALSAAARVREEAHPDDAAVDRFAAAMKAKLKWEREERGRHGWNDPEVCSEKYLARLLIEHLAKGNDGNFEDVANFCMMLHQRGAHPRVLADALTAGKPEQAVPSVAEAERERIANALEEEADTTPCSEDAVVVRDCARLVRANFSYEDAERLAEEAPAAPTAGGGDE